MRVEFGRGLSVDAMSRSNLVSRAVEIVQDQGGETANVITSLHVGGLAQARDSRFVAALRNASLICADGTSIVLLAQLAGGRSIERAPTTDVGLQILRRASEALGRPARLALVGGAPGLANRAGLVLAELSRAEVAYAQNGFMSDWRSTIEALNSVRPDIVFVGLGSPLEAIWSEAVRTELPGMTLITCGGWFGHLTGAERRAPRWLQRIGLEWVVRLAQSPRRLWPRYAAGVLHTASFAGRILMRRRVRNPGLS